MNYKRLVAVGVGFFALVVSAVGATPFMHTASAAGTGFSWVDAQTIVDNDTNITYKYSKNVQKGYDDKTSYDDGFGDADRYEAIFVATSGSAGCTVATKQKQTDDQGSNGYYAYDYADLNFGGLPVLILPTKYDKYDLKGDTKIIGSPATITFSAQSGGGADTGCAAAPFKHVALGDAANASVVFNWVDKNTIVSTIPGQQWTYTNSDATQPNTYFATNDSSGQSICHSYIQLKGGTGSGDYYASLETPKSGYKPQGNCYVKFIQTYNLGQLANSTAEPGTTSGGDQTDTDCKKDSNGNCVANNDVQVDCGSGSFNWLACPFIQLALKAAQNFDNFITNTLDVDVGLIFDNTSQPGSVSNGYYRAWSDFRVIATAVMVIAGLVMVISQALGFDFLDAYTVRKTLPRLVIATVGISLSWPLMRLAVNFFDVLGFDTRALIYAPFQHLHGTVSIGTGIWTTLGATAAIFLIGPASLTIILSVLIALFVAFITLMLRQILLVMLIIVAPIAIVCFILPNTEKVWHLWRDTFGGLLLAFPIVSAIIAAGNVFSVVAISGDSSNTASLLTEASGLAQHFTGHGFQLLAQHFAAATGGVFSQVAGVGGQVVAAGAVPGAVERSMGLFKTLTGGVTSKLDGLRSSLSEARMNGFKKRKDHYGGKIKTRALQSKVGAIRNLNEQGSKGGAFRRAAFRFAANRVEGIGNAEAEMSANTAHYAKEIGDQIATGRDSDVRGLTVNKRAIDRMGWKNALAASEAAAANGDEAGRLVREHDGKRQYKSLGGAWVEEADVMAGHRRYGHSVAAQQAALSYEMRKGMQDHEVKGIGQRYAALAQDQWGQTQTQASDTWIGASFENQNQHLEYKNMSWKDGSLKEGGGALIREAYEKKGSYQLSQMSAQTIKELDQAHTNALDQRGVAIGDQTAAQRVLSSSTLTEEDRKEAQKKYTDAVQSQAAAEDHIQKARAVAETFMHELGTGGAMIPGEGDAPPVSVEAGGSGGRRQASSQGSGAVAEAVRQFAVNTSIYASAPNRPAAGPPGGPFRPGERPESQPGSLQK
jgi:hypothetical protein